MPITLERPTPEGAENFKIKEDNDLDSDKYEKILDKPEDESEETLPQGAKELNNSFRKTSFLQKAGRFMLSKLYQFGLEKSDLNNVFVKEVANPENYDNSIDEIKAKSEQKYSELYTKTSIKEIFVADEKIRAQIDILKSDDSKLVNMKYKGLKALSTDLDTWKAKLGEIKSSENTSENDKKDIELTEAKIEDLDKQLEDLEAEYIEKKSYKPSITEKIFDGFINILRKNKKAESYLENSRKIAEELNRETDAIDKDEKETYEFLKGLGYRSEDMEKENIDEELLDHFNKESKTI